jgi:hypothetical protein
MVGERTAPLNVFAWLTAENGEDDMIAETTINIGTDIASRLKAAAADRGVSRREMISALLNYSSRRMRGESVSRVCVRYQERRPSGEWHRLHVVLRRDEYDFFVDLRKVFRMSVSLFIAMAIELYLDEMIAGMVGCTDNYRYRNYAMIKVPVGDITCWLLCWGIHPELARYLPREGT